jgi:hypothetical protein
MENELRTVHGSRGVVTVFEVSNAILNPGVLVSSRHRREKRNIGFAAHIAADVDVPVSQQPLNNGSSEETRSARDKYFYAGTPG